MKRSIIASFLILGGLLLSVTTYAGDDYVKVVKHDLCYDVSKIGPVAYGHFVFSPAYMDPFYVDYNLTTSCPVYKEGEINNKALPLGKKRWLLYCQLSFK